MNTREKTKMKIYKEKKKAAALVQVAVQDLREELNNIEIQTRMLQGLGLHIGGLAEAYSDLYESIGAYQQKYK